MKALLALLVLFPMTCAAVEVPSRQDFDSHAASIEVRLTDIEAAITELRQSLDELQQRMDDMSSGDTSGDGTSGGGTSDLGVLPSAFDALKMPIEPMIVRDVTVTTASELMAVEPGTRVIIGADIEQTVYVPVDDIHIDLNGHFVRDVWFCATRKTCTGDWSSGSPVPTGDPVHRILITGPGTVGSLFTMVPLGDNERFNEDIRIDGISVDTRRTSEETGIDLRGKRVAVLNTNIRAQEFAISGQKNSETARSQDVVIAHSVLNSFAENVSKSEKNEATVRLTHGDRVVMVDNVLQNGQESTWSDTATDGTDAKHNFRVHGDHTAVYFARNLVLNSGAMMPDFGGAQGHLGSVWIVDNTWYRRGAGAALNLNHSEGGTIQYFEATGNIQYKAGAEGWNFVKPRDLDWIESTGGTHQVQDNAVHDFQFPPDGWLSVN